MPNRHKWSIDDDILVFCIYKLGEEVCATKEAAAAMIGTSEASVEMRIKNYQFLDSKSWASKVSKQSIKVYDEWNNKPKELLQKKCKEVIAARS